MDLGLTELQAKLYLALSKIGPSTIKSVHKVANIARQDVYRLMPTLEKAGLAEKMLTSPIMYKATPLKEGYQLLLQNKTKEHIEIEKNTLSLIDTLENVEYIQTPNSEEEQFIVTSSIKLITKKFDEKDSLVQKSIDCMVDWRFIRKRIFDHFEEYTNALKRGIRIRIITEDHKEDKLDKKIMSTLEKNPLFEIRYLSTGMQVYAVIHDGIEANLCVSSDEKFIQSLGSKNPQFVKVIKAYFEELWKKGENKKTLTGNKITR